MIMYYIIVFFVIGLCLTLWVLNTSPLMHDDYDLKPEDIWPLDQRPVRLSDDDYKILNEHLDNPQEANSKLKEAAKNYNS